MDEAGRLISELQQKLSELDHKVWQYRQDMTSEFTKYAEDVLRDVPKEVSETVSKAIAGSIKGSRSLNPDGLTAFESCATGTDSLANRINNGATSYSTKSTTTMSCSRDVQVPESPQSPHEREKEFQGLFTPSYLPLLDSTSRKTRRSSYEPQPSLSFESKEKSRELDSHQVDAATDTRSLMASPQFRRPETPKRRNTDECSIASDVSDGHVRRSALRRSSSSSKGLSPRRVRFDVAGEEVLPTASPLPPRSILSEDIPPTSLPSASDEEAGSEQIEDVDEPPPKRISSSQAIRALSRGPFEDDGTHWTAVSAPPDGSASIPAVSGTQMGALEEASLNGKPRVRFEALTEPLAISRNTGKFVQATQTETPSQKTSGNAKDAEAPSDDDMLDMPPLASMRGRKSTATILSPIKPLNIDTNKSSTATKKSPSKSLSNLIDFTSKHAENGDGDFNFLEDEHEELFHFDENNRINDQKNPLEEEQADTDSDSPVSPTTGRDAVGIGELSRSPAQEIPKPSASKPTVAPTKSVVGSYKGRPFSMPVVSDEIHAQAASLGVLNSFVGSVNGRSGLDESDVQSFRASGGVGSFSGTPKSMSERMMMDDLLEAEEAQKNAS